MATRPHLLGLPAELRLRIYSFVFADASYYHGPDQVPYITKRGRKVRTWDRAKDSFAELKDVTSIIWVNQQLRQEALSEDDDSDHNVSARKYSRTLPICESPWCYEYRR